MPGNGLRSKTENDTIPKGLRPPARGWRATPTLGCVFRNGNNANGVVVGDVWRTMTQGGSFLATGTQPRWGLTWTDAAIRHFLFSKNGPSSVTPILESSL